ATPTDALLGIVSDVYPRSREKFALELARVASQLLAGERVELDAAAMTASPVVWHWRQITGPAVELEPREASMDFIAPDVDEDTPLPSPSTRRRRMAATVRTGTTSI